MNTKTISYFEKAESTKHREFIISQSNCVLCGTVLELKHITDRSIKNVKEEAYFPQCNLKTRTKIHNLN